MVTFGHAEALVGSIVFIFELILKNINLVIGTLYAHEKLILVVNVLDIFFLDVANAH